MSENIYIKLKSQLFEEVAQLKDSHTSVKQKWEQVSKFRKQEAWHYLSPTDIQILKEEVSPILPKMPDSELAKKFDLLSLYTMLGTLDPDFNSSSYESQIRQIASALRKKATIPEINAKMPLLNQMITSSFWENKSLSSLENMRIEIRELMKYLIGEEGNTFIVTLSDEITDNGTVSGFNTGVTYKEKVLDFLKKETNHPVLQKIYELEKLSKEDIDEIERIMWKELGTKEDYNRYLEREQLSENLSVAGFLRRSMGMDRKKAVRLFSEFISENDLTGDQEEFINSILNHICQNGDSGVEVLRENDFIRNGLIKIFPDKISKIGEYINHLHSLITVA